MYFYINITSLELLAYYIRVFFIFVFTLMYMYKITYKKFPKSLIFHLLTTPLFCLFIKYFQSTFSSFVAFFFSCLTLCIFYFKTNIFSGFLISLLSIVLSFSIYFLATTITFFIVALILPQSNDIFTLILLLFVYLTLLIGLSKNTRINEFIINLQSLHIDKFKKILLASISFIIIALSILMPSIINASYSIIYTFILILLVSLLFIGITKAIEHYYKKNLFDRELNETKEVVLSKDEQIEKLTAENLALSKEMHSLKHKLRFFTFKSATARLNNELSEELSIHSLTKKRSNLDSILEFTRTTCEAKGIEFESKIDCDLSCLVPACLGFSDLEILLSDLLTNAIISMDCGRSTNGKLLLSIYQVGNIYSIDVYDRGISFEPETLLSLGIKACSTHLDEGGSGMGFLNIFDTLKASNASICISEFTTGEYSKCINISFNDNHTFTIKSKRSSELELLSKVESDNCSIVFETI